MLTIRACAMVMAAATLAMGGCATYVNIPPQLGDMARNDPNIATVAQVEAASVQAVLDDRPIGGQVTLVLPEGSTNETYGWVLDHVEAQVTREAAAGRPVIEVRQLRVRGWHAEADVIRPSGPAADSPPQLVTASLRWEALAGWQSVSLRPWRIPVAEALKQSRELGDQPADPNVHPEDPTKQ